MTLDSLLPDRFESLGWPLDTVLRWWIGLDDDWQAVYLGLLSVVAVRLGVHVPW
ncbi:hypothetical protein VB779_07130 [Haloarculaceae archaeon H-GB11]|nr:hypothetical protein [Haloarculaceae archaeon H-GB11]